MSKKNKIEEFDNIKHSENVIHLSGMYKNWFLDYASYVILERSVPYIQDGLKPVQRRILHSLKQLDDGRYHKVANVIGNTMKYHPHGDASIGDAMVQIGNKNFLKRCLRETRPQRRQVIHDQSSDFAYMYWIHELSAEECMLCQQKSVETIL